MHVEMGEIKRFEEMTKHDLYSGKWIEVPKEHLEHLQGLNRKERRDYLRKNGLFKNGKWGWL